MRAMQRRVLFSSHLLSPAGLGLSRRGYYCCACSPAASLSLGDGRRILWGSRNWEGSLTHTWPPCGSCLHRAGSREAGVGQLAWVQGLPSLLQGHILRRVLLQPPAPPPD